MTLDLVDGFGTEEYSGVKFKTKFIAREIDEDVSEKTIQEIIDLSKKLNQEGLTNFNAGNVSVRHKKGMLITGTAVSLGRVRREDIVQVASYDAQKEELTAKGLVTPSSESIMHLLIYKNFATAKAIVHVHDEAVQSDPSLAKALSLKTTRTRYSYGTVALAREAINALSLGGTYIILRNHGSLAIGITLAHVAEEVIEIHKKFIHPIDTINFV